MFERFFRKLTSDAVTLAQDFVDAVRVCMDIGCTCPWEVNMGVRLCQCMRVQEPMMLHVASFADALSLYVQVQVVQPTQ